MCCVEVEVDGVGDCIEDSFFVDARGEIYDDLLGVINASRVFHSKAKAELFAEGVKGKQLQVSYDATTWVNKNYDCINWSINIDRIRVKPDEVKQYKPYTSVNWDLYGKTVKSKDGDIISTIIGINKRREPYYYAIDYCDITAKELFEDYTFEDGFVIGEVIN